MFPETKSRETLTFGGRLYEVSTIPQQQESIIVGAVSTHFFIVLAGNSKALSVKSWCHNNRVFARQELTVS